MGHTYCFRFQARLTEEEYCHYIKNKSILYVNNELIEENNIIFDKCDKTLGTVNISVDYDNISQKNKFNF